MKVEFDIIGFSDHRDNFLLCHESKFQEFQIYNTSKNRTTYTKGVWK